jgi:hypothetical protein
MLTLDEYRTLGRALREARTRGDRKKVHRIEAQLASAPRSIRRLYLGEVAPRSPIPEEPIRPAFLEQLLARVATKNKGQERTRGAMAPPAGRCAGFGSPNATDARLGLVWFSSASTDSRSTLTTSAVHGGDYVTKAKRYEIWPSAKTTRLKRLATVAAIGLLSILVIASSVGIAVTHEARRENISELHRGEKQHKNAKLLAEIRVFPTPDHFEYFDEIRTSPAPDSAFKGFARAVTPDSAFKGFALAVPWSAGGDHVRMLPIPGPAQGLLGNGEAGMLGGAKELDAGAHLYLGFVPIGAMKQNSFGVKAGFKGSSSDEKLVLFDVNGNGGTTEVIIDYLDMNADGFPDVVGHGAIQYTTSQGNLGGSIACGSSKTIDPLRSSSMRSQSFIPDKVFQSSGGIAYRLNLSRPAEGTRFSDAVFSVLGRPSLGAHASLMLSYGVETYPGSASLIFNVSETFTHEDRYLSDVNGDGLPDFVEPGTIRFNTHTASGSAFVANDSGVTPLPIVTCLVDPSGLVPDCCRLVDRRGERQPKVNLASRPGPLPYHIEPSTSSQ